MMVTSCSKDNLHLGIKEVGSTDNLFGFEHAKHLIGPGKNLDQLNYEGLVIHYIPGVLNSVTIEHNANYELSNGIGIGSSKKEIYQKMGKPILNKISLNKGMVEIGRVNALIYDGVTLFLDKEDRAKSISFGEGYLGTD